MSNKIIPNNGAYFIICRYGLDNYFKLHPDKILPFKWQGIEIFAHKEYNGEFYNATDKVTGFAITEGAHSFTEAVITAKAFLNTKTIRQYNIVAKKAQGMVRGLVEKPYKPKWW